MAKSKLVFGLSVKDLKRKIVLTIDNDNLTKQNLIDLIHIAILHHRITEADFDSSILTLGNELKEIWWNENKEGFLKGIKL